MGWNLFWWLGSEHIITWLIRIISQPNQIEAAVVIHYVMLEASG